VYEKSEGLHVSGHACQEELKILHALCKPKFFIPVHGEQRMLQIHGRLAQQMGMSPRNIVIGEIGSVIELSARTCKLNGTIPAGKVFVDGTGVGDVGSVVLRDRKHLAQDGMIVVCVNLSSEDGSVLTGPDIVSRGFVQVKDNEDLMEAMRMVAGHALEVCQDRNISDWATIKSTIKNELGQFIYRNTKKNPMILPVIMEI
jgi:ribonuclease J